MAIRSHRISTRTAILASGATPKPLRRKAFDAVNMEITAPFHDPKRDYMDGGWEDPWKSRGTEERATVAGQDDGLEGQMPGERDPEIQVPGFARMRVSQVARKTGQYLDEFQSLLGSERYSSLFGLYRNGVFGACVQALGTYERQTSKTSAVEFHQDPELGAPRTDQRRHLDEDFKKELESDPDLMKEASSDPVLQKAKELLEEAYLSLQDYAANEHGGNDHLAMEIRAFLDTPAVRTAADGQDQLLETLSSIEHDQWIEWSKAVADEVDPERKARWEKLWVPYAELTEESKDQDRDYARKVLAAVGDVAPAGTDRIEPPTPGATPEELAEAAFNSRACKALIKGISSDPGGDPVQTIVDTLWDLMPEDQRSQDMVDAFELLSDKVREALK